MRPRSSVMFLKSGDVVAESMADESAIAFDGTVSYLDEMRRICSDGRECTVVSVCSRDAEIASSGIRFISVNTGGEGGRFASVIRGWRKVGASIKRIHPDLIVALDAGYYAPLLCLAAWIFSARLVLAAPGQIGGTRFIDRLRRRLFVFVARSPRTLLVMGRGARLADDIVAAGVERHKVIAYFPEYPASMLDLRSIPDSELTGVPEVVYLGRLAPVKGVDNLPALASALESTGARLRIIGDGPCRCELERDLKPFIESGTVIMEGGMPTIRALERVARADLSIVPSRMEGIAKSAMESVIVGVPVVAFDVGGISEWVESGVSGALVPSGDTEALCERAVALLSDHRGYLSLRESTRTRGARIIAAGPTFTTVISAVLEQVDEGDEAVKVT